MIQVTMLDTVELATYSVRTFALYKVQCCLYFAINHTHAHKGHARNERPHFVIIGVRFQQRDPRFPADGQTAVMCRLSGIFLL